jgi:hypothetical protein
MSPTPEFQAARRAEQRRRLLTHLGLAEPITLPLLHRPGLVARISLVPLTERHRLELHLAGNAFFTGRAPLLGDVIQFLWRLSPHFRRPDGTYPNQPARGGWLARLRSALERRALAHHTVGQWALTGGAGRFARHGQLHPAGSTQAALLRQRIAAERAARREHQIDQRR